MLRQTLCLMIFSLVVLSGCGSVERPDTDMCVVNVPGEYLYCYNLKRDYTDEGVRKKEALPTYRPLKVLNDVNKYTCTDPQGMGNLKVYIKELKKEVADKCL
jgi:hypothetical protein